MNAALDFFTRLGPARLADMSAVTVAIVGFFGFVRVSQPAMGVLFADLSPQDAGAVARDLEVRNIRDARVNSFPPFPRFAATLVRTGGPDA